MQVKNFGATINGSLNSIESATAANTILGLVSCCWYR